MITPGQFEVPGQTPITDPLQLQFMTQGQMGYMPQAQFLTPYQYGNFRTMPTPDVMGYAASETGFFQNWLIANRGGPFGLPAYTFDTYNPAINARQQQEYARRRIEDSRASLGAFGAELAVDTAVTAFGGIPGMVASMIVPDWMRPSEAIAQRRKTTREIQNLSTAKIFTGADRDQGLGYGFGFHQARGLDKYIREAAADDSLLKEGDWRDMLSLGMKYGQFDYANNAEQYKRILKNMRGNMTTMMEVIGSTDFEEIMKNMKRMQDMGAQQQHYMNIARKEQQYARVAGIDHQQMVNTYGQSGALTFQQMGLNAMQGSITSMSNAALATYLQRTGAIDPTLMAHFGGVSGMAQQMTQASAKAHRNIQDTLLAGMMNEDFTGLAEGLDLVKIVQDPGGMDKLLAGAGRVNTIGKQRRFNVNRHKAYADLQEKYGPEVVEALMAKMAGQRLTGGTGDDALFYGYQALGYSSEEAEARLAMVKSGGIWEMQKQAKEEQRRKAKEEREQRNSPLNKIGRWFESMKEGWGQRLYNTFTERGPVTTDQANAASETGNATNNNVSTDSGGGARSRNSDMLMEFNPTQKTKTDNEYAFKHMNDLDAVSVQMETGGKGMIDASKDNYGYAFGKYQTNTDRGSQQEWMAHMWATGGEEGKGVVTRLLRSAGINDEVTNENVLALSKKINFNNADIAKNYVNAYVEEAKAHEGVMASTQYDYIKTRKYDRALQTIKNKNAKLGELIESDVTLQQQLFSAAVQHGEGLEDGSNGAPQLFLTQYREGMDVLDLIDAVERDRPNHFRKKEDRASQRVRHQEEGNIYHALYNMRHGLPLEGVKGEATEKTKNVTAAAIANYGEEAIKRNVKYALGARDSRANKGYKDYKTGKVMATTGNYIDCSGAVVEGFREMAKAANEAEGYTVYSQEMINKVAEAATSDEIIDVTAKMNGGQVFRNGEITEDLIKEHGTMFLAMDTGVTSFDANRKRGIDHITYAYWDPEKQKAMIMQSSSGKGVNIVGFDEYMSEHRGLHKKGGTGNWDFFATSATGFGKYKGTPKGNGTNGGYEGTSGGRTKEQIEEDEKAGAAPANARQIEQLNKEEWVGGFGENFLLSRKNAYRIQNDIGIGELEDEEAFNKQQDINAKFYNARMRELAESLHIDTSEARDLTRKELDLEVQNKLEDYMQTTKSYSGIIDRGFLKKDVLASDPNANVSFANVDLDKLESEHVEYQMNLENARRAGYKGDSAKRIAFEMTMQKDITSYQRAQAARNATEGRALDVKDNAKSGFERANKTTNTEDTLSTLKVYEQVRDRMMGSNISYKERTLFSDEYRDIIMNDERDPEGKAVYARGAYAEKIPEIANLLGHLAAVEAEYKERAKDPKTPKERLEALENRKAQIIDILVDALGAYKIPAEKVREIIEKYTTSNGRLDQINAAIGEGGGIEWDTKASTFAKKMTSYSQERWSNKYEQSWWESDAHYNENFAASGKELERLKQDPYLNRMRSKDLTLHQIGVEFQDSGKMFRNLAGIDYEQLINLKDQPKSVQDAALERLRSVGETEVANEIEQELKAGKNPDKATLDKLKYNKDGSVRRPENAYDAQQRSMAVDNDPVKAEIQKDTKPYGPMGQQPGLEGNGNLDGLPGTLDRLNNTMDSIDKTLSEVNRTLKGPKSGG